MDTLRNVSLVVAMVLAASGQAFGQVQWAADFQQASQAAADQNRLLLLHFYSDDCPPCIRVEQQVFSKPEVAAAIAKNYVPVKIHARQSPELARRYQVTRWPTDVFCTPAGLEVYRTVSPQTAAEYMGLVDQVALQTGVGAGKQWASNLQANAQQATSAASAQAQAFANRVALSAQGYADQAAATTNGLAQQTQYYTGQAQQGIAAAQQTVAGVQQQFQQTADQATQQAQATAQQFQNQYTGARDQLQGTAQQAAATAAGAYQDLRSAWIPGAAAPPPAAVPSAGAAAAVTGYGEAAQPGAGNYQPQASGNPWIGQQPGTPAQPQQAAPAGYGAGSQPAPALPGAPNAGIAPQLVPASQAPAIGLEGYCPVTLLESMKWKKADPKFGAIHRGRTYLFASEVEQQKFLAEPDRYSPVLSGCDPVRFAQRGELVEGTRSCGLTFNKQIFLFADEASLKQFEQSPQTYIGPAYQAMSQGQAGPVYR